MMRKPGHVLILILLLISSLPLLGAPDTQNQFKQGMEAINTGNYSSAELLFKRAMDSDDPEIRDMAQFYHARSIFLQKKYRSAIFEFNSYLNQCRTTALCVESRYWIGESFFNLGEYPNAIEEYKRFITDTKDKNLSALAHDRIGAIYFMQNRYDEAILEWDQAINQSDRQSENAARILRAGDALYRSGRYEDAGRRLSPLLTSSADPRIVAEARLIMGRISQSENAHMKALVLFNAIPVAMMKESPFCDVYYFRAKSYMAMNQMDAAKSQLDLFIHIGMTSPWFHQAKFELGRLLGEGKEEEKGIALLEEVYRYAPDERLRVQAALHLSRIYLKNQSDEALPYLEEALKTDDPEDRKDVILLLGRTYVNLGRYSDAEKLFIEFMEKYPYDPAIDEVMFLHARISIEKGETERARELLDRLRTNNPFSPFLNESSYYLAMVHYRKDEPDRAIQLLREYLSQRKTEKDYEAHVLLLSCYMNKKDKRNGDREAGILMTRYRDRKSVETVILQYAMSLYRAGDRNDYYFTWILKNYPETEAAASLNLILGHKYYSDGRFDQALDYYNRYMASGKETDKGLVYYNILICLYNLKKYDIVISTIKKGQFPAMEEGQWKEIPLILSRSYFQTGQHDRVYQIMFSDTLQGYSQEDLAMFIVSSLAVDDVDSAIKAQEQIGDNMVLRGQALMNIGAYYLGRGNTDRAIDFYTTASLNPVSSVSEKASLILAEIHYGLGHFDDALARCENVRMKELAGRRNAIQILCLFKTGKDTQALAMAGREMPSMTGLDLGRDISILAMNYCIEKENLNEFRKYAYYLGRYPGQTETINLLSGDMYFRKGDYRSAFFYYARVAGTENGRNRDSSYRCGIISMMVLGNKKGAIAYLEAAAAKSPQSDSIRLMSLINLGIISHEMNDLQGSRRYLQTASDEAGHSLYQVQARNLMITYGYLE